MTRSKMNPKTPVAPGHDQVSAGRGTDLSGLLDLLADIASLLLVTDRPEKIVGSVFRKVGGHFDLKLGLLYLADVSDKRNQPLRLITHSGLPRGIAARQSCLDLDKSFRDRVARRRKRILAEQLDASNSTTALLKAVDFTSYACFPLLVGGHLMGTLSFGIRKRGVLEHEELAMLDSVCSQVAAAIERGRTEQALQKLHDALEKRVDARTAKLREINDQMEAFAYSVSHDLRAPLRAIRGFAQALTEDYGKALDETGRDYLHRMGEGAERLDTLIQDLLQYSRLGRSTLTFGPIDLEKAVQQVLNQLAPEILAAGATIEVQKPLPLMLGHEPTLEQVLINLLSNALKFVAPGVKPQIRIWSSSSGPNARLWIGDNGIGIAQDHHHRIFGVFERLHAPEAYPGTGIGLAIVAKGIARMGGSAGVESTPGEGSQFWIELPRPAENPIAPDEP